MSQQTVQSQIFQGLEQSSWQALDAFPGTHILPLAEPIHQGSIHRLRMEAGTVIPLHTHPCDEYVYVLSGTLKTGERLCDSGTFWFTPAGVTQGPHTALTEVELLTVRLGPMGTFEAVVEPIPILQLESTTEIV
ncbi:MAG: cupin domain-containing protein [Cyanobacteria bacterium J06597_16]